MNKDEFIKRGLEDLLKENEIINIEKEEVIDIELKTFNLILFNLEDISMSAL